MRTTFESVRECVLTHAETKTKGLEISLNGSQAVSRRVCEGKGMEGHGTRCGFIFCRSAAEDRRLNFLKNTRQIWGWGMRSNLFDSFDEAAKAGNGSHIWKVDSPDGGCFWVNASTKRKAESLAATELLSVSSVSIFEVVKRLQELLSEGTADDET